MKESDISDLFASMDMVVMEQGKDRSFNIIGTVPVWFKKTNDSVFMGSNGFCPEKIFPFLEGFFEESKKFWDLSIGNFENCKSGWWTEIGENDEVHYFQATAISFEEKNILIIEHATKSSEIFSFLQHYKEGMVEFENLLESQKNFSKDSDKLSDLALSDKLTGLYNERAFFLLAKQQQKMAKRKKFSALIIMLGIDNIELINKKYGEAEGFMVLVSFAKILKHTFRETDVIARFADNGFVVLAIEINKNGKKAIVSRLKNNIKHHNSTSFKTYDISTSMGIAHFEHDHTGTIEELIKKAGFRMNEEKKSKTI